ncbi:MAG: hypothetical protein E7358_05980 [Clostridiales bacterium]|nr:hypothetical protein [Clostridiales bacterium]
MKGLIFILIIYAITFLTCVLVKVLLEGRNANKKGDDPSSPKIYYITKQRKPKEKQNVIPISATLVEKEDVVE